MPFNSINYVSLKTTVITSYLKCFKSWPMGGRGGWVCYDQQHTAGVWMQGTWYFLVTLLTSLSYPTYALWRITCKRIFICFSTPQISWSSIVLVGSSATYISTVLQPQGEIIHLHVHDVIQHAGQVHCLLCTCTFMLQVCSVQVTQGVCVCVCV